MFRKVVPALCVAIIYGSTLTSVSMAADPSLVGRWKLDETSGLVAKNSSPNGNDGTLIGNPTWTPGQVDGGLYFDGFNDYVETNHTTNLSHWTVAVWVTSPAAPSEMNPCGPVHREKNYQINWNHSHPACRGSAALSVGGGWYSAGFGSLEANRWYHLAATYDGSVLKAYKDGVLITTNYTSSGPPDFEWSSLKLGRHAVDRSYFHGTVDDVRLYSRALRADEIPRTMQAGEDWSIAANPEPGDGATIDWAETVLLSWTPGDNTTGHDVYVGTDREAVEQANNRDIRGIYRGRQTEGTLELFDELAMGQTWYWRVDEIDQFEQKHQGPIWSFQVAAHLLVEGFESYDDLCNQIFFSWSDGVGHVGSFECRQPPFAGNGTASTVGRVLLSEEQPALVHSGVQSMQLSYDNARWPYHSQTEKTLDPTQDWTQHDVNTVTIYVRGAAKNEEDTLYLGLEDRADHAKIVTHPDPQVVTKSYWQAWNIPLSDFTAAGVDLGRIERITVGIGSQTASQAGGKGTVYIDEIQLTTGNSMTAPIAYWSFDEDSGDQANDSAGSNDGTVLGAIWDAGQTGDALWFDGFDDYVNCGTDAALAPELLTVSFWMLADESSQYKYLLGKAKDLSLTRDYAVVTYSDARIAFSFGENAFQRVILQSQAALPLGQWIHVTAMRDGETASLYLNGQLEDSAEYTFKVTNKGHGLRLGSIGTADGWAGFFQGALDEVRIYDQALSPEEIKQLAGDPM